MRVPLLLLCSLACAASIGCDHDDRASELGVVEFGSSTCLSGDYVDSDIARSSCVESRRTSDTLEIEVHGVESLCLDDGLLAELPWKPAARISAAGQVTLMVEWPSSNITACGACTYDFTFKVGPHSWADVTDVNFEVRPCSTCDPSDSRSVTLKTHEGAADSVGCDDISADSGA